MRCASCSESFFEPVDPGACTAPDVKPAVTSGGNVLVGVGGTMTAGSSDCGGTSTGCNGAGTGGDEEGTDADDAAAVAVGSSGTVLFEGGLEAASSAGLLGSGSVSFTSGSFSLTSDGGRLGSDGGDLTMSRSTGWARAVEGPTQGTKTWKSLEKSDAFPFFEAFAFALRARGSSTEVDAVWAISDADFASLRRVECDLVCECVLVFIEARSLSASFGGSTSSDLSLTAGEDVDADAGTGGSWAALSAVFG